MEPQTLAGFFWKFAALLVLKKPGVRPDWDRRSSVVAFVLPGLRPAFIWFGE